MYFQTIGNLSLNAQTGFADWSQDFPNPSDFYLLLSKAGIQATNNENFGNVNDPKIESQLANAAARFRPLSWPASTAHGRRWTSTSTDQAYMITYGYSTAPKFTSNRIDYQDAVFHSVNYMMFSTLSLK